jgi:hypothetical protein
MIFPCQCPFFIGSASHGGPSALWISDDFSQMAASLKDGLLVVGVILPGILTADRRLVIWSFFCAKKPWNFSWFSRGKKTESWLFVNVHDPNIPPFQMEWKSVSTCFVVSLNGGAGIVEIFRWMKRCDFRGLPQCNHVLHPCVRNQVTFWENRGFYTKKV